MILAETQPKASRKPLLQFLLQLKAQVDPPHTRITRFTSEYPPEIDKLADERQIS